MEDQSFMLEASSNFRRCRVIASIWCAMFKSGRRVAVEGAIAFALRHPAAEEVEKRIGFFDPRSDRSAIGIELLSAMMIEN